MRSDILTSVANKEDASPGRIDSSAAARPEIPRRGAFSELRPKRFSGPSEHAISWYFEIGVFSASGWVCNVLFFLYLSPNMPGLPI